MQPTDKWKLVNYFDVWGNAEEGYEVNDLCVEFDDLHIEDDATSADIINYLKGIEFLNNDPEVTEDWFEIEDNGDFIEISRSYDSEYPGYPICRLERIYE